MSVQVLPAAIEALLDSRPDLCKPNCGQPSSHAVHDKPSTFQFVLPDGRSFAALVHTAQELEVNPP